MKFLILIGILCNFSSASEVVPKIVGGRDAEVNEFPYIVSIRRAEIESLIGFTYHVCGGTIITSDTVLTACHCLFDPFGNFLNHPGSYFVVAGSTLLWTGSGKYFLVTEIFGHPDFNQETLDSDIAVLKVAPDFTFTLPNIQPLQIVDHDVLFDGLNCSVHGWGFLNFSSPILPDNLKTVDLQISNFAECNQTYDGTLTETQFCAYSDGKDSCSGDSGSPFVCNGLLTGIVSFGDECAKPDVPGVYTKVSSFLNYIDNYGTVSSARHISNSLGVICFLLLGKIVTKL